MLEHTPEHSAQIRWNGDKSKYELMSNGEVLVASRDKGYLNYLVVKQKHSAVLKAGVTKVEVISVDPKEACDIPPISTLWGISIGSGLQEEPRKRGRRRKHFTRPDCVTVHHMSDRENDKFIRQLLPITKHKIKLDYEEYLDEGVPGKQALEKICELYKIEYSQAFSICEGR